jgi:hypothetical protein
MLQNVGAIGMMMKRCLLLITVLLTGCATDRPKPLSQCFQENIIFSEPLTVQEVERRAMADAKQSTRDDIPQVPFGFLNEQWKKMKAKVKPGDRLVAFDTPQEDWDNLGGMTGYALIRGDLLIDIIVTRMN